MEAEFLAWLAERVPPHRRVPLGIGDDAALLATPDATTVVTVDMLTEGVDFRLAEVDPRRVGRKALAVNLSDLAAMAARPTAVVIAAALPRHGALELAKALYEGMLPLCDEFDVALAGGDTNTWDGGLVISVTAFGSLTPRGPLRRDGAKPGDVILVTGALGGSILGHHFDFQPRIAEALALHERYTLHAGMDISDGLALDLSRLAKASGCGACLDLQAIPSAPAAHQLAAEQPGKTALDHALGDGEDFELLLAVPADEAARIVREQSLTVPITAIGRFVEQPGLWQSTPDGKPVPLATTGWQH
ncbi:MAG: thiamine-monophosphate kinase [Planctomycetes bacterium]|nr:thiamine-monophosphate kinase [Planctomycetota bacterium]